MRQQDVVPLQPLAQLLAAEVKVVGDDQAGRGGANLVLDGHGGELRGSDGTANVSVGSTLAVQWRRRCYAPRPDKHSKTIGAVAAHPLSLFGPPTYRCSPVSPHTRIPFTTSPNGIPTTAMSLQTHLHAATALHLLQRVGRHVAQRARLAAEQPPAVHSRQLTQRGHSTGP